jgi:RNA polymerase sigma-70 factor (ECF subfamily)
MLKSTHAEGRECHLFDAEYIRALKEGVPRIEEHFATYFENVLRRYLRRRMGSAELVEDIRQETFVRVLRLLQDPGRVRFPERLGALMVSICNNVRREYFRGAQRWAAHDESVPDRKPDPEALAMNKETRRAIIKTFAALPERDREILRAAHVEQCSRRELCRRFHVTESYLPVILHRAKLRFRKLYQQHVPH